MHNSQNSISCKATFKSIVLAQAKLLGIYIPTIDTSSSDIKAISSDIADEITEQPTTSNISEAPTFHTPTVKLPEVTDEMQATFSRLSAEACKRAIISESAQDVLDIADDYGISYKYGIQYTDKFTELKDKVSQWEYLLAEALDWCIYWDKSEYDPLALRQEIEDAQHASYLENRDMSSCFNSALALEA